MKILIFSSVLLSFFTEASEIHGQNKTANSVVKKIEIEQGKMNNGVLAGSNIVSK